MAARRFGKLVRLRRRDRPTRYFYCRVREPDGRESVVSTGCTSMEAARAWKLGEELREAKGERAAEDLPADTALARWIEDKALRAGPACLRVFRCYQRTFEAHFGKTRVRMIERSDVTRYLRKRQLAGATAVTINNERRALVSFFRLAVREGWTSRDPMAGVPKIREERRAPRALNAPELARFLEECRAAGGEDLYAPVFAMARSGLRGGTVSRLEWADVDFTAGEWRIPGGKMKSGEDFAGRPVAPDLLAYLRERRKPAGRIFRRIERERWKAAAERAGFAWLRPHDLRRGFLTELRERGVPLEVAMWLGDWRDVGVALKVYREIRPEIARDAIRAAFSQAPATTTESRQAT